MEGKVRRSEGVRVDALQEKLHYPEECNRRKSWSASSRRYGRLVVSAPLKAIEPAPEQPAIRSIPISVEAAAATVTGTGT